jgi:indolepyruvate ferredoxin oxidoreductase
MRPVTLEDKYSLADGQVFLSGTQALVRLMLDQKRRDASQGWNTAGYVSGYRGSPLAGVDFALWQARAILDACAIRFEPGLNEELAADAVWGTQQIGLLGAPTVDGVFGMWYAKNPGVDRALDALKHANYAGSHPRGGVLAVSGDDPAASSSSTPNQCDQTFMSAFLPVLHPSSVADILEMGQFGFALSRYSGLWVGFKLVADTVESSASLAVTSNFPAFVLPNEFALQPEGLGVRWPDDRFSQDARLLDFKIPAAKAFARANGIDQVIWGGGARRLGLVSSGKPFLDLMQALAMLGIDETLAARLGVTVFKAGMAWPLEPERMRAFAEGLETLFVIEERRSLIEAQVKEHAFTWPAPLRPRILGKVDEQGRPLLPQGGELSPGLLAQALAPLIRELDPPSAVLSRIDALQARLQRKADTPPIALRTPHFCAGCPHARSTRLPDGSVAFAGIGCHSLAMWMPGARTMTIPQMGGEGACWIGLAPYIDVEHIFQNMGDGTYAHSGILGIRAAVAAKSRLTFRILLNQAVAMTGGQPVEGPLDAPRLTRQLAAEGVERIALVADDPGKYGARAMFAAGVTLHPRSDLARVTRELAEWPGVSALVYDQICATEKRRLAKRGKQPARPSRPFINQRVCEGCGHCVEQSGCAAVLPVETPFGRKRQIDQSACNTDYSCLEGFCPSFVTIAEARLSTADPSQEVGDLPPPPALPLEAPCDILVGGVGGTGIITIGALIGMAAHLEGQECRLLDNTGMARKGGAVSTHIRLAPKGQDILAVRIGDGQASLLIACDLAVSAMPDMLAKLDPAAYAVMNSHPVPTLQQRLDPDADLLVGPLSEAIRAVTGPERSMEIDATLIAETLVGESLYANMVLLGFALQKGLIPLPLAALERVIELNGVAVALNRLAFSWGRKAAHDPKGVAALLAPFAGRGEDEDFDRFLEERASQLALYQNEALAKSFTQRIAAVRAKGGDIVARAAARAYYRLLAVKDEYEVARLFTDGEFDRAVAARFSGGPKLRYHMALLVLAKPDPERGGLPPKTSFGPWFRSVLSLLAAAKGLRGGLFDPFRVLPERREERRFREEFESALDAVMASLRPGGEVEAAAILDLFAKVRGYGPVKLDSMKKARSEIARRLSDFRA